MPLKTPNKPKPAKVLPTFKVGSLVLTHESRSLIDPSTGIKLVARTLQPSKPYGGWPGTAVVIREWSILPPDTAIHRKSRTTNACSVSGLRSS